MIRRFPKDCGILCRVAYSISEVLKSEQGNVATVTPGQLSKIADVPPLIVGEILRALESRGYVKCERVSGKKLRCSVSRDSPLWSVDYREILKILESL